MKASQVTSRQPSLSCGRKGGLGKPQEYAGDWDWGPNQIGPDRAGGKCACGCGTDIPNLEGFHTDSGVYVNAVHVYNAAKSQGKVKKGGSYTCPCCGREVSECSRMILGDKKFCNRTCLTEYLYRTGAWVSTVRTQEA